MSELRAPVLPVVVPSGSGWPDVEGCSVILEREGAMARLEVLGPKRYPGAIPRKHAFAFAQPLVRFGLLLQLFAGDGGLDEAAGTWLGKGGTLAVVR